MPESTQEAVAASTTGHAEPAAEASPTSESEAKPGLAFKSVSPEVLAPSIEAVLLSVDRPVPGPRLAEALGLVHEAEDAVEQGSQTPGKKKSRGGDRTLTPLGQI
ncbi:MAG: hypothetical protein K2Q20_11125, partial [Phycisphaerales bacterium]|nr:hypothetical protein [Phycisphaerales bacterium]